MPNDILSKIKNNIENIFYYYETITDNSFLVNNLFISTSVKDVLINDSSYVKLLVSDRPLDSQLIPIENINLLYYNNNNLDNFDNIFNDTVAWLIDIPENFDEQQYLKNNPEVANYYLPDAINMGFSDRQRIYHHFLLFYYRFLNDDQKLWLQPVDIEFNEEDYLSRYPKTENYYLPWAEENGYSKRQRLYHHYLRFNQKYYSIHIEKTSSHKKKYLVTKSSYSYHKQKHLTQDSNENKDKIKCKLLIKIPTLGRESKLLRTLESFQTNAYSIEDIAFCISGNTNDTTINNKSTINKILSFPNVHIFFDNHQTKIEAYNADINRFDFDIVVAASDDMIVTEKHYDRIIAQSMNKYFTDLDGVLWFDTGDNEKTDTLSIVGKKYYERFNYIYHTSYQGYFCDDEFTQIAYKLGKIIRINKQIIRHDIAQHLDMSDDNTYLKSLVFGASDKAMYKIRKKMQFNIPGANTLEYASLPDIFFDDKRNKNETRWPIYFTKYDDPISVPELYILEKMDIDIANMTAEEFLKFAPNYFRDFRLLIPPIIHQIWFGEISSEIKMMMETFSKEYTNKYPGWRYILWTEEKLNNLDMINKDLFMKEKKYDAKSDIARLEILNRFGGWYLDSDFVWLGDKPLSSLISVVKNGFIISYEKNGTKTGSRFLDKDTTRVANGFLGSTISNPIIAFIIGQMRESYGVNQNEGAVICSGPDFVQSCLDSISGIDISILDHKHFFPAWWCLDKQRNTSYDEHIQNTSISIAELGKKYPSSIAYHMGFTSKNEYSHGNEL
jgi:hypothetical protein